jgi:hypothetical protein
VMNSHLRCLIETNQQKGKKKEFERVFLNHVS